MVIGDGDTVEGGSLLSGDRLLKWTEDGALCVWDLASNEGPRSLGQAVGIVCALAVSIDRVLSCSRDRTVTVWDLATGQSRAFTGDYGSCGERGCCRMIECWRWGSPRCKYSTRSPASAAC